MKEEIIEDILSYPPNFISSKWIIERIPHLFNRNLELYIQWKEKLSSFIDVDGKAIVFTGSAAIGYSLNPDKSLKAFDGESDIDVAIISSYYFDVAWHTLRNIGTKRFSLKPKEKSSIDDHRTRLIYWGTIATDKIIQIMPFGKLWVEAINQMSKVDPTIDREINFRIYRDFEALRAYQIESVNKIKDILIKEKE